MKDEPLSAQEVADRLAIEGVIARYVHGLDAGRIDDLDDVFAPDAHVNLSSAGLPDVDWPDMKRYFETRHQETFPIDHHLFGNFLFDFDPDGVTATTRYKVVNVRTVRQDGAPDRAETVVGFYTDTWKRREDGWRIVDRVWKRRMIQHGA
jgi:hypothetical protein